MTAIDPAVWGPGRCVDTSGLLASFYPADDQYDVLGRSSRGSLTRRRLFVNDSVLDELLSLRSRKSRPEAAIRTLDHVRRSESLSLVRVPDAVFERSLEAFTESDDHSISFTDHVVSAHAFARDAMVYTFDTTDVSILGNDVIPAGRTSRDSQRYRR